MRNGYVVYPSNRGAMTLKRARQIAKQDARDDGESRIENVDTQKIVARYRREGNRIVSNPGRRTKRKNAPARKGTASKLLKNFTGVVRLNKDKTVSIVGTGRKPNPAKRKTAKRKTARRKR